MISGKLDKMDKDTRKSRRAYISDSKGRRTWVGDSPWNLFSRLDDEIGEFHDAMAYGLSPEEMWAEAADVAAFAMMVADAYESSVVWRESE